jgi:hypothetical protein
MSGHEKRLIACFQVSVQFAFSSHKAALVSAHIKQQKAPAFLVRAGLPFGHGLKYRRYSQSAFPYVMHHAIQQPLYVYFYLGPH